jgi:hypothetical protein
MPYPATSHTACVTYGIIEDILLKDYKLCAYASGGPNIEQERRYKQKQETRLTTCSKELRVAKN